MPESFFWKQIGLQKLVKLSDVSTVFNSHLTQVFNKINEQKNVHKYYSCLNY